MKKKKEKKDEIEKDNISEKAKKLAIASLGAVFLTQENILKILKELKLPKEVVNSLIQQIDKNKEDFIQAIANQFGSVLRDVDLTKLMKKLISGLTLKVDAEITLTYKFDEKEKNIVNKKKKNK